MSVAGRTRGLLAVLVTVGALGISIVGPAWATVEPHPQVGRLPAYPALRGIVPALASQQARAAREALVKGAFAAARAQRRGVGAAVPNEQLVAPCENEALYTTTQDVCYRGGPVLHDPVIHLIFWQGPLPPASHVKLFPANYVEIVSRYFEGLAHDNALASGVLANTFGVQPQYFEENEKKEPVAGTAAIRFEKSDVTLDTTSTFPSYATSECDDASQYSQGGCLLDTDIQKEAERVAGTSTKGLGDVYVVLTPPGVGGCFQKGSGECAYQQYCAYHSDFGGNGVTPGLQTLYVDLPYLGRVPGCDSGVHPSEEFSSEAEEKAEKEEAEKEARVYLDEGADAVIDTASHELNETISDPIGSQCRSGASSYTECERNAWTDVIGQEIADKCLPPESTVFGVYGDPLGEVLPGKPMRIFNQQIDGHGYYVQRVWSNDAGLGEGACVQRAIDAGFTVSAGARATVPMTLDGSGSGAPGDPAVYWVWSIAGSGEQFGSENPTLTYSFAQPGRHVVGLTAYDAYGNARATLGEFTVGVAPPPPPPPAPIAAPAPITLVIKEPVAPEHLTTAQLAMRLGLPANARKLTGTGPFALGHGECPPACAVTLRLYASVTSVALGHRTSRLVQIASARKRFAAKGGGSLELPLSASGRALLRRDGTLACKLVVAVEGQEGGSWQIARALTLRR